MSDQGTSGGGGGTQSQFQPEPQTTTGGVTPPVPPYAGTSAPYAAPVAGAALYETPPLPVLGQTYEGVNTSGQKGEVPAEINGGWNWGAFMFGWIWAFSNGVKTIGAALLAYGVITNIISRTTQSSGLSSVLSLVGLAAAIYMGTQGNKLAWQNRVFPSVENFKATQKIWAWWALGFVILLVLVGILAAGAIMAVLGAGGTGRGGLTP